MESGILTLLYEVSFKWRGLPLILVSAPQMHLKEGVCVAPGVDRDGQGDLLHRESSEQDLSRMLGALAEVPSMCNLSQLILHLHKTSSPKVMSI